MDERVEIYELNDRSISGLDDDEIRAVQRFVADVYAALMPMPGTVSVTILQSLLLTTLQDFPDPLKVWKVIQKNVEESLPKMIRNTTAGSA